jgi:hypothetical protein
MRGSQDALLKVRPSVPDEHFQIMMLDLCRDPAGSQESAPELRLGCDLASRTRRVALRY